MDAHCTPSFGGPARLIKIKNLSEERSFPSLPVVILAVVVPVFGVSGVGTCGDVHAALGSIDDLIELATVEPDAAALRTIVNLDALAIGHFEFYLTCRTFHDDSPENNKDLHTQPC
jgi:hypothetical protein